MAITFALLSTVVFLSGCLSTYLPLFGQVAPRNLSVIDLLSEGDIAALKANLAVGAPAVGLFGNSRSVQLSADDIGVPRNAFFNYSVPGGSFRQSVNLIATFSGRAGLPETIIVSVDHFEMAFMSRAQFPGGPQRWWNAAGDVSWILHERGPVLAAHALSDHLQGEWRAFSGAWNVTKLLARVRFAWSAFSGDPTFGNSLWRPDGSRILVVPNQPNLVFTPKNPFILQESYLVRDLQRVAKIGRQRGLRIILYESPLDPSNDAIFRANPSSAAARLRDIYLEQCRNLQIECYSAPRLGGRQDGGAWADCCHAPAGLLGRFVGSLI